MERLKNVLISILARNEDEQQIISRRFDRFFDQGTDEQKKFPEVDIQKVLNDLKSVQDLSVTDKPESISPPETKKPPKKRKKYTWVLLVSVLILILNFRPWIHLYILM